MTWRSCAPYALRLYSLGLLLSAASYVIANAGRIAYYFTIYGVFALEQWLSIQPNCAHACYVPYFWLHGSSLTVRMHALSTRLLASFPIVCLGLAQ